MAVAGAVPEHETAQQILDELLNRLRFGDEQKAHYRQRLGLALLMETVETMTLIEEGRARDDEKA